MPSRILVTGATGTVGSLLVRELSRKGESARAAVHSQAKAGRIAEASVEIFEMDFGDKASVDSALKGIEKVYLITPFGPAQAEMANFFVDRAKAAGVSYIVRQSVFGADTEAITLLRQHRTTEAHIEGSGIPWTHLRPNAFMQNFVNYMGEAIRTTGRIYLPLKTARVSYIDCRDIASVAAELLVGEPKAGRVGRAYSLTGPAPYSLDDAAASIAKASGRPVQYVDAPPADAKTGMRAAGMADWAIEAMMELYEFQREGRGEAVSKSVEEVTGKKPFSLDEFTREYARAFKRAA